VFPPTSDVLVIKFNPFPFLHLQTDHSCRLLTLLRVAHRHSKQPTRRPQSKNGRQSSLRHRHHRHHRNNHIQVDVATAGLPRGHARIAGPDQVRTRHRTRASHDRSAAFFTPTPTTPRPSSSGTRRVRFYATERYLSTVIERLGQPIATGRQKRWHFSTMRGLSPFQRFGHGLRSLYPLPHLHDFTANVAGK